MESITILINSVIDYISGIDFDAVGETIDMIMKNINFETIKSTFEALGSILASIGGMIGM